MNPHQPHSSNLLLFLVNLNKNNSLIIQMIKREVLGRYKGSALGLAWSLITPLLMLAAYTFVFSVVFKARWVGGSSTADFAILLFVGMIIHGLFSDVINRSPSLILSNTNYVTKMIFPLEILPIVVLGAAIFHALISVVVLLFVVFCFNGFIPATAIFFPLLILPFILFILGVSWVLTSLGVFVRDVGQTVGVLTSLMMFLSPVFYPLASLPPDMQMLIEFNPLTFVIEESRKVLIFGSSINFIGFAKYSIMSIAVFVFGFVWFQKTRKGFADVI